MLSYICHNSFPYKSIVHAPRKRLFSVIHLTDVVKPSALDHFLMALTPYKAKQLLLGMELIKEKQEK